MGSPTNQSDAFESLFGSLDLEPSDPRAAARDAVDISDAFASVFVEPEEPNEVSIDLELDGTGRPRSQRPAPLPLPQPNPRRDLARNAGARSLFWAVLIISTLLFALSHGSELLAQLLARF